MQLSVDFVLCVTHTKCHVKSISHIAQTQVLTFIRPGTMPGLLLNMIKELPYNQRSAEYMPLSRVQIYSAEDDSMSLNLFVYGEEAKQLSSADVTMTGSHILEYAQQLMDGTLPPADEYGRSNPKPNDIFKRERLIEHMEKCAESYIIRSDPRRFLSHYELFERVSGSDNISVSIEVRYVFLNRKWSSLCVLLVLIQNISIQDSFLDEKTDEEHYWVDIALA